MTRDDSIRMSVVIPTHNKPDDVVRCIQHILQQTFDAGRYEIIVVDDGSRTPVEPLVQQFSDEDTNVSVVRLEGRGPACARNAGIRTSVGDIVAFCDDDAVPQANYLNEIYNPFVDSSDVVGVEGAVIPVEGEEFGLLGMSPQNTEGGVYLTCNIAFRRSVLERVGGLDETFPFPAFEDCDLAAAIEQHGEIVWAPKAAVHHPRRCWSLKRAIREIKFNEPLVLFARRYGYFGWPDRPTRFPALRAYWSAVVALPLGRVRKGLLSVFGPRPLRAIQYTMISGTQGVLSTVMVIGPILKGCSRATNRADHLKSDA